MKIEKCPFCGGAATVGANEYYDGANTFYIYCTSCGVQQMTTKIRTDEAIAAWNLRAQPEITGETSDGYHTFNELYHHRAVLFSVICNDRPALAWKSKLHHDGTMYDGMFIVGIETPDGQATYHYDIEPYWEMFNVQELPQAPGWDGHTPAQAIERIGKLNPQPENARQRALQTGVCPMCEDCPDGCPVETPKDSRNKMTNAQRIRGMSDEELAEILSQIAYARYTPWVEPFSRTFCDDCPVTTVKLEGYYHEMDLHKCDFTDGKCPYGSDIVYWLQQPAKEEA